jgi:protein gp37
MSDDTAIEWTNHTFNPWWGCSRVSPGCRFCYADDQAKRYGHQVWRRKGPRRMLSEANWGRPLKWNREAEAHGEPAKVFCASMADVFEDHPDVAAPRERLWEVIESTPWLTWQLLTKRPENVNRMVPWDADPRTAHSPWPANVWLGASVENERYAWARIPELYGTGARTLFLSCEPLLGPVDIGLGVNHEGHDREPDGTGWGYDCVDCSDADTETLVPWTVPADPRLSWVIIGGESGPKARPAELEWIRDLVAQCRAAQIAPFVKQLGRKLGLATGAGIKGGHWDAWPEDLRVREFPRSAQLSTQGGVR